MIPARYPAAVWRPVSYASDAGQFQRQPLGWILHVTCMRGSPWNTFDRAPSGNRRFSHLWVAKDGTVEQYQLLTWKSWAQADGNGSYWSVETDGQPGEPLTDAQVSALAAWHSWSGTPHVLAEKPGDPGIGTHFMGGAAWGGHTCPDPAPGAGPRSKQRAAIIARARHAPVEDDMQLSELAGWDVSALCGEKPGTVNFQTFVGRVYKATVKNPLNVDALAEALAKRLPAGAVQDPRLLAAQLAEDLAARLAD